MAFVYLNDNNYVFPRLESKYKFYDWFMKSENKRIGDTKSTMTTLNLVKQGLMLLVITQCLEHELSFRYNQIIKDLLNVIGNLSFNFQKIIEEHSTKQNEYMLWKNKAVNVLLLVN